MLIKKYRINPKYIEVEITESMLMKSFDKNVRILDEIKKLGVSIALDDFGTGYSSLNYLTKLPIDVLKIDRSFLIDLMNNPKSKCIVENIINLSHQLGIEVVAEGVEDRFQVEYLRRILCDVVQGYYFSRPKMFNQIKDIIGKEIGISIDKL
jgi:EAL domain-containing protein (putative c-di-GMP-specific phosphodiesterase class I)